MLTKTTKSRIVPPFGDLGLVGKRMVDFLLVLFELFVPAFMVELDTLCADIGHFERKL